MEGIEPPLAVLETAVLPLNDTPNSDWVKTAVLAINTMFPEITHNYTKESRIDRNLALTRTVLVYLVYLVWGFYTEIIFRIWLSCSTSRAGISPGFRVVTLFQNSPQNE